MQPSRRESAQKTLGVVHTELKGPNKGKLRQRLVTSLCGRKSKASEIQVTFSTPLVTNSPMVTRSQRMEQRKQHNTVLPISHQMVTTLKAINTEKDENANIKFLKQLVEAMKEDRCTGATGIFRVGSERITMNKYKGNLQNGNCPVLDGNESPLFIAGMIRYCLRALNPRLLAGVEHALFEQKSSAFIKLEIDHLLDQQESYRKELLVSIMQIANSCIGKQKGRTDGVTMELLGRMLSPNLFPDSFFNTRKEVVKLPSYFKALCEAYIPINERNWQ